MARYTGPVCRQCRREGAKLFLKGNRCYTEKCPVTRRSTPPGQHKLGRKKVSEYGLQLREKQKARRTYGILEKQFRKYFSMAERMKGVTGEILLQILERRLDNVIFRLGFAKSRPEARQLVRHGHFEIKGKKVDIPSYLVNVNETIAVREKSKSMLIFKELSEEQRIIPEWLQVDMEKMEAQVIGMPTREDIDVSIEEHLIVELYSK